MVYLNELRRIVQDKAYLIDGRQNLAEEIAGRPWWNTRAGRTGRKRTPAEQKRTPAELGGSGRRQNWAEEDAGRTKRRRRAGRSLNAREGEMDRSGSAREEYARAREGPGGRGRRQNRRYEVKAARGTIRARGRNLASWEK